MCLGCTCQVKPDFRLPVPQIDDACEIVQREVSKSQCAPKDCGRCPGVACKVVRNECRASGMKSKGASKACAGCTCRSKHFTPTIARKSLYGIAQPANELRKFSDTEKSRKMDSRETYRRKRKKSQEPNFLQPTID